MHWQHWKSPPFNSDSLATWLMSVVRSLLVGVIIVNPGVASSATTFGARYERALNFVGGLQQVALTAEVPLALHWEPLGKAHLQYFLEVSGGAFLDGSPDSRPFLESGPMVRLYSKSRRGWFIGFGVAPTLIGGSEFRDHRTLGGSFFFTTHLAFGWRTRGWLIALRFQHTSNADFNHPNPGVNMIGVVLQKPL